MRSVDKAVPTIDVHRPAMEPFPAILHIGIARQPVAAVVWDDGTATWDGAGLTWDDVDDWPYQRMDLFCRFHGLTVSAGNPDAEGIFESAHVEMTLDNRDGALSLYDETGRLIDWQPGSPLDVWAVYGGESFWLFSGRITAWREQSDGTLDVEAFDAFSELQAFRGEWTPGVVGQTPAGRLTSICTAAGFTGRRRFDTGDVTLLTEAVDVAALEEMFRTARSDGGVVFCDADGTLVYRGRNWLAGRPDQPSVPELTDNYCDGGAAVVWDAATTTADDDIVNWLTAGNIAEPTVVVEKRNDDSILYHGVQTWPSDRSDDLWSDAAQGEALADWIVNHRALHRFRVEEASLYLHDPRFALWPVGLDLRIGDLVDWTHEQAATGGPQLIDIRVIVVGVVHDITPDSWVVELATSPAVDHRTIGAWDRTPWMWDDVDTANVWN
jgi:hypothetical protein